MPKSPSQLEVGFDSYVHVYQGNYNVLNVSNIAHYLQLFLNITCIHIYSHHIIALQLNMLAVLFSQCFDLS